MSKLGQRMIAGIEEAIALAQGGRFDEAFEVHHVPDVRAIRGATGLTREAFAARFGLSLAAVRDWEQKRRVPDPAAQTLLRVIARHPEAAAETVAAA